MLIGSYSHIHYRDFFVHLGANIIVVETAKPQMPIGFRQYFRAGLPVTLVTVLIGWAWRRLFP